MMKDKLERSIRVKENGKIGISLKRKSSGILGNDRVDNTSINISELKVNNNRTNERKFVMNIVNSYEGKVVKLAQLSLCSEQDLIDIRNTIDIVLDTTYSDNKAIPNKTILYEEMLIKLLKLQNSQKLRMGL